MYFSIHRYEQGEFWPHLRESNFDYIGGSDEVNYCICPNCFVKSKFGQFFSVKLKLIIILFSIKLQQTIFLDLSAHAAYICWKKCKCSFE